jgi:hypothetical protein
MTGVRHYTPSDTSIIPVVSSGVDAQQTLLICRCRQSGAGDTAMREGAWRSRCEHMRETKGLTVLDR